MGLLSNTKWVALSQIFKVIVQLLNIIVLAKLIPPGEFGLMAMALVVINFSNLVRDLGTAAAIIQKQDIQDKTINAIFWLNVIVGCILALFIIASSPLISYVFHEKRLILVLCLLSISFPVVCASSAHLALLEKQSRFREIAFIDISSSLFAAIIAIFLAYKGGGIYSLVVQSILISFISSLQIWNKSRWRPKFGKVFNWLEIKNIFVFSGNLTIFNFINYFSRNMDSVIIGHYLSATILGAYSLAYRIMLFPLQNMTFVASRALFPVFSENQNNNEKLRSAYLNTIYIILLIVLPLMIGLATLSESLIKLVFGDQWSLTGLLLVWLAPTGIIQSVLSTSGSIFMAKGRTDILMRLGILGAFLQISAFLIGAKFGIVDFVVFYFIANVINFFPVMFFVMKIINGRLIDVFLKVYKLIVHSIFMCFLINFIRKHTDYFFDIDSFLKLGVIIGIGVSFYLVMIFATEYKTIKSMVAS
ncbi:MOP flippase family protein [Dickeya fangzhongdai]|uniref:MOP flippase family protein n=1 Tax=Dickeya fangzhongdai TaxID=1778540 RepID=UPI001EFB5C4E|nr:MOP flippase family protein [Dickeya fangzhongdai]ULR32469.1 MOP flippase family protein [Dickeya fangzhongdai]